LGLRETKVLNELATQGESGHLFTLDPRRIYPVLTRGEGVHVWDAEGNRYLDAIAGIATVTLGYGRTEVVEALASQAARLPFAASNIFANEPVIELARAVAEVAPGDLDWVHFTSGGSEAIEVAIKMARQYHVERGQPKRHLVIGRQTSYHGATIAGLSVAGAQLRRRKYEPLLMAAPHIPAAYCYRCPWGLEYPGCGLPCASDLERTIATLGEENVAAFIVEPIVASVGGAIPPRPEYFPEIREICDRHGVLLIVDEVVTGFGRTGKAFAVDHWNVVPDLMVVGKGLSGGYAPLGAVVARRKIHQAFVDTGAPFEHIFTYGGNPISAAAGLVVLDIWAREQLTESVASLAGEFAAALEGFRAFEFVGDVRSVGFMAGIEFVADRATREPFPADLRFGSVVRDACLHAGVITYPGSGMADGTRGDIISLYPPLTFTRADIDDMAARLAVGFAAAGQAIGRSATPIAGGQPS
jgi:adenosylmethionine-8-amino-7-oxononanoate aminotransferase